MKELMRWLQGGLAGIGVAVVQLLSSGHATFGLVAQLVGVMLLVRAAGWVTQKYGPQVPTP
jgi:hypothetical protein